MPDLIAQGQRHHQRWRRPLNAEQKITLGRTDADWLVPWDIKVSRTHVEILWNGRRLEVRTVANATNPIFHQGNAVESLILDPDEHFVIGNTTFTLTVNQPDVSLDVPIPATEQAFSSQFLRESSFQNAEQQIEALSEIPDIIAGAIDDQELLVQVVRVLLKGITKANAIAIIQCDKRSSSHSSSCDKVDVLHWDSSTVSAEAFKPSERLIRKAVSDGQSVVHVWSLAKFQDPSFTQNDEFDWAFCTPIRADSRPGWGIYASGGTTSSKRPIRPNDLKDDLKFAEIVSTTIANFCDVRSLQKQREALSRFFSPTVMQAIAHGNAEEALAPRETEISVLFCDLRGFSRRSEKLSANLDELMEHVSQKLGIATSNILKNSGVIGDFHGDCAMGFWGWPIQGANSADQAVTTALAIRDQFNDSYPQEHELQMGIGIATGTAVVGQIGTLDQKKVTAFGPVVNIASRLENLNRFFNTEILMDQVTVQRMEHLDSAVRAIGIVKPYGMEGELKLYQLTPNGMYPPEYLAEFKVALDDFVAGDWAQCQQRLTALLVRAPRDGACKALLRYIEKNQQPPSEWNGVMEFRNQYIF